MRCTRKSCWASFCPKSTWSGRTMPSSFATTVSIPSKWPGRDRPSKSDATGPPVTLVCVAPSGYISSTVGANTKSTPRPSSSVEVAVEVARVLVEVLVRAELQRVHEDRDDDRVGELARPLDEGEVPVVQGAQGRHERDRPPLERRPQRGDRLDDDRPARDGPAHGSSSASARHPTPGRWYRPPRTRMRRARSRRTTARASRARGPAARRRSRAASRRPARRSRPRIRMRWRSPPRTSRDPPRPRRPARRPSRPRAPARSAARASAPSPRTRSRAAAPGRCSCR